MLRVRELTESCSLPKEEQKEDQPKQEKDLHGRLTWKKILSKTLLLGMGIQIALGLAWLILNFPASWEYPESRELFKAAESWQLDEYTGVLYPLLLRIFGWLTGNREMLLKSILSILQLGVAFLAYKCFLKQILGEKKKWKAVFGTCFLLTVPLVLQWHLSLLPYSFASSLLVLLLGNGCEAIRSKESRNLKRVAISGGEWMGMSLLLPDFWWLGLPGFLVVCFLTAFASERKAEGKKGERGKERKEGIEREEEKEREGKKEREEEKEKEEGIEREEKREREEEKEKEEKKEKEIERKRGKIKVQILAIAVIAAILPASINTFVQTPGCTGRIQRSLGAALLSRFSWPEVGINYFFWPAQVQALFTEEEARDMSQYADNIQLLLGPRIESTYGRKEADSLYWQMALRALQDKTRLIVENVGEDFAAYLCMPWAAKDRLDGSGTTLLGWEYGKIREAHPILTGIYMDVSFAGFRFGLALSMILLASGIWQRRQHRPQKEKNKNPGMWRSLGANLLLQAVWYTMSAAGMLESKNGIVGMLLWYTLLLYSAFCVNEEES